MASDPLQEILEAIRRAPVGETPKSQYTQWESGGHVLVRANRAGLLDIARACIEAAAAEPGGS